MATFICAITAPLFVNSLKAYLPVVDEKLTEIATIIQNALHIFISVDVTASILFATLMAFLWGIGFFYIHR